MEATQWQQIISGEDCPFDPPRVASSEHWDFIEALSASSLYLTKNQTYRGQCLLILDLRHATRPDDLSSTEWGMFCSDLYAAEIAITQVVQPDHINVAALGNVVPHLHWHIVPRYVNDPRWGAPIWPSNMADMPDTRLAAPQQLALVNAIRAALAVHQLDLR